MKILATLMLLASSFVAFAQDTGTIVDVASEEPDLISFVTLATQLGIAQTLSQPGNYTVFAPTDAAFDAVSTEGLSNDDLTRLLLTHVVVGSKIQRNEFFSGGLLTATGSQISVAVQGANSGFTDNTVSLGLNAARVRGAALDASNGIVHKVDKVVNPPPPASRAEIPPGLVIGPGAKSSKSSKTGKRARRRF